MTKILVLGAGKIGSAIAHLLHREGDCAVTVADQNPGARAFVPERVPFREVDANDSASLRQAIAGFDAVVNGCPYHLNVPIATVARDCRVHYFDLTEDVTAARAIRHIAEDAGTVFVPQCGLAPGFVDKSPRRTRGWPGPRRATSAVRPPAGHPTCGATGVEATLERVPARGSRWRGRCQKLLGLLDAAAGCPRPQGLEFRSRGDA